MKLELHKIYNYDTIEKISKEYELKEKVDGFLQEFSDASLDGEIGEIVMPLYFDDGGVACNFILNGYGSISFWRCIYICQDLSGHEAEEI